MHAWRACKRTNEFCIFCFLLQVRWSCMAAPSLVLSFSRRYPNGSWCSVGWICYMFASAKVWTFFLPKNTTFREWIQRTTKLGESHSYRKKHERGTWVAIFWPTCHGSVQACTWSDGQHVPIFCSLSFPIKWLKGRSYTNGGFLLGCLKMKPLLH